MNEKTIISTTTLVASLITYAYAKVAGKDAVPYVMIGGFVGSIIGETIVEELEKNKK